MVLERLSVRGDCDCASEVEARGSLPGVRERQNVYGQKEPKVLVRMCGARPPLGATVYSLNALRCGACRAGVYSTGTGRSRSGKIRRDGGPMIAATQVRQRDPVLPLEQLEGQMGIPLPAATQWEVVQEAAELLKPRATS